MGLFVSTSTSNQWEGEGKLGVSIPPVRRLGGSNLDATSGSSPFLDVVAATQLMKFKGPGVVNPPLMGLWAERLAPAIESCPAFLSTRPESKEP